MADSLADQLRAKTTEPAAKSKERDAARARFLSTLGINEDREEKHGIIVHILPHPRRGVDLPSVPGKRWIYSDDYPDDSDLQEYLFLDQFCEQLERDIPVINERLRRNFDSPAAIADRCRALLDELERFDKPFHVDYFVYWILDGLRRMREKLRGAGELPSIPDEPEWTKSEFRLSDIGLPPGITHNGLRKLLGEIIDAAEGIDRLTPSSVDYEKPATGQPQVMAETTEPMEGEAPTIATVTEEAGEDKARYRATWIVPAPFFVSSEMTYAVQAADLCIYCVNWGFRLDSSGMTAGEKREEIANAFGLWLSRLQFRGEAYVDGTVHGVFGIRCVPDPYTGR